MNRIGHINFTANGWIPKLFALALVIALTGCTTSRKGVLQEVQINSYPYEARVYLDGELVGATPLSLKLRSKSNYEVKFEKSGYKPYVEYIAPDLDLKQNPILKLGPLEEGGFYNRLGPNPLEIELEHVLVPDIAGVNILSQMLIKTEQLDNLLKTGKISVEEHRYVTQQLLLFYKDEAVRRGTPLVSMAPVNIPAFPLTTDTVSLTAANAPDTVNIPGELDALDNLDLDSAMALPPAAFPPTPATIPDLSVLDNLTIPEPTGNIPVPTQEPSIPPPPTLSPRPAPPAATPLPNINPVTEPAPTTPPSSNSPAPFDPLNFGSAFPSSQ